MDGVASRFETLDRRQHLRRSDEQLCQILSIDGSKTLAGHAEDGHRRVIIATMPFGVCAFLVCHIAPDPK
jgi:hypothetical protein